MALPKFSIPDINSFAHRVHNCMENSACRQVFRLFLQNTGRRDLLRVLNLWERADSDLKSSRHFDEDHYLDTIEEIDGFNENPLLSLTEYSDKLNFIKMECCNLLQKIHQPFLKHLRDYHRI